MADKGLTQLGKIISDSMEAGFLGLAKEMVRVFEVWEEAVGSYNASKSSPESFKNGHLTVLVASPVWIDHFSYLKERFIENINQALGTNLVTEITFRVGTVTPPAEAFGRGPSRREQLLVQPSASAPSKNLADIPALKQALTKIKDPELRERLAGLLSTQNFPRK
ncbi:MAG: DUF721 domain-containing protein [Pseudomonadota bacterium]